MRLTPFVLLSAALALSACTTGLAMKAMNGIGMCPPSAMQSAQSVASVLQNLPIGSPAAELEGLTVERRLDLTQRDGRTVSALMYRTGHPRCRNMPTEEEFTPVMVQDGQVVGIGTEAFNEARRTSRTIQDVTPEAPEDPMTFSRFYKSLPF